jgi:membrane-bound lytic murein transglycosylase D
VHRLSALRRGAVALLCTPLILLTGCPQQQKTGANSVPANATAPSVQPAAAPAPAGPVSVAAAVPQTPQDAAHDQAVQQLIGRAEAAYNSGVQNYRGNRLESARADFDRAVDMMLTSGMDLKADPQLSDEFDRLLNSINSLEMSALKQGTGFSAPIEAAPLDTADEVTFPANPELKAKVEAELKTTQSDLPLVINDYVAGFISYFSNSPAGHAHLLRSLERAGKYKDMIQRVLREEGVPQDLIYLAVAESGFQPQAVNRSSGAAGMWQFMPFRGAYGLERNGWVDERFDPEKSSRAYAKYIKSLYNQFGDWYLALAAYDWGPGYVQRAVMKTGYADFWELYRRGVLPNETKNYVPGIIAAAIMAKNPKQYGLEGLTPDPPLISDTVTVNYSVDLRLVADVTNASLEQIVALNPSLLRMTTPQDSEFELHIPAGTQDLFLKRIETVPQEKRTSWRFHVVKAGESLDSVASMYHSRTSEIASANQLTADASIEAGDELVVPIATASAVAHPQRYTVRAGDTLVKIADRFDVTVEELRRWNHLSSAGVRPGRTLSVSQPVHLAPVTRVRSRRGRAASGTHKQHTPATHTATHGATHSAASPSRSHVSSRSSSAHSATSKRTRKKK